MAEEYVPGLTQGVFEIEKEQERSKKEAEKQVGQVVDKITEDFSLCAWGYTEPLKVTLGDKIEYRVLKIKSIGINEILEQLQAKQPTPPSVIKTYKKGSEVAQQLGYRHDVSVRERDETDPTYMRELQKYNSDVSQYILLSGLAYNLTYKGELVLKGEDIHVPSEILNMEKAMLALKRWGLSSNHFATIVKNIRELTSEKELEEDME